MDAPRELFERIKNGGTDILRQFVDEQQEESLFLDFKTAANNSGPMTKDDLRTLAKALSGFANSEGGVIVWGVNCRTIKDSPDVVQDLRPIASIRRFKTDLESNTGQVVSPAVIGVEHATVDDPSTSGSGYVLTYVPKSEGEPHMAIAKDQHCYFTRSGSAFMLMESHMVADRYHRRPQPKLELTTRLAYQKQLFGGGGPYVYLILGLRNVGLGLAVYPAVTIYRGKNITNITGWGLHNDKTGLPQRLHVPVSGESPSITTYAGSVNDAIHPGTEMHVARVILDHTGEDDIEVDYELYCEGFSYKGTYVVQRGEMDAAWPEA